MPDILDAAPYLSAEDIAVSVRAILNDISDYDISGDLFSDDNPAVWIMMNDAYTDIQDILIDKKVATWTKEAFILAIPPSSSQDRANQCSLTFTGFTQDGVTTATPILPTDLLEPLVLWERLSGTTGQFLQMKEQSDGKPSWGGQGLHRTWDWRQDSLYLPTSTQTVDLKLRYQTYAPAITGPTSPVLIIRVKTALAYLTAARFSESRGGATLAATQEAKAMAVLNRMGNRENARRGRRTFRRRRYRSGGGSGGGRYLFAFGAAVTPAPPPPTGPALYELLSSNNSSSGTFSNTQTADASPWYLCAISFPPGEEASGNYPITIHTSGVTYGPFANSIVTATYTDIAIYPPVPVNASSTWSWSNPSGATPTTFFASQSASLSGFTALNALNFAGASPKLDYQGTAPTHMTLTLSAFTIDPTTVKAIPTTVPAGVYLNYSGVILTTAAPTVTVLFASPLTLTASGGDLTGIWVTVTLS